jgi:hypothetical protein
VHWLFPVYTFTYLTFNCPTINKSVATTMPFNGYDRDYYGPEYDEVRYTLELFN